MPNSNYRPATLLKALTFYTTDVYLPVTGGMLCDSFVVAPRKLSNCTAEQQRPFFRSRLMLL